MPLAKNLIEAAGNASEPNYIESVFSTYLYTGTGASRTITNGIDLATKGGMIWIKDRTTVTNHCVVDTVQGITKNLVTNTTAAAATVASGNDITSFTTSGWTFGNNNLNINNSGDNFASWSFAKATKFFDVVTYTGNGSGSARQIAHSLGSAPGCIIVKRTDNVGNWFLWHRGGTQRNDNGAYLSSTSAYTDYTVGAMWGAVASAAPDMNAATFEVTHTSYVNTNGATYVAYIFAHDAGGFGLTGTDNVISCGSYVGDGTTKLINVGFEPQWILIKNASSGTAPQADWRIVDNMRGFTATGNSAILKPNLSDAETNDNPITIASQGFNTNNMRTTGDTYIYIAIRRGPMKVPTDATKVFKPQVVAGSSSYSVGFPTDFCLAGDQSGNALNTVAVYRLAGNSAYFGGTASTAAEQNVSVCRFDLQDSFQLSYNNNNQARWHFRRAPSFFDEVCYTGTGATSYAHNLGAVPELMIVKCRDNAVGAGWAVYSATLGATKYLKLQGTDAAINDSGPFGTTPTNTVFYGGGDFPTSYSGYKYVAYLFATCAGVSKVGNYTGTGTTKQVDCGFAAGARFVLIKRTDSTGDWYVWDTARGIVSGNDPYLLLNSTAAEVTTTDYIDTYSAGFELSSTAPAALNASGGTYIFLAIA